MSGVHRFFALQETPPFDRLRESELALIADVALERTYAPGEAVHPGREPFSRLYVLLEGQWQYADGQPAPRLLGVGSLLFDQPASGAVTAHPDVGARVVTIGKSHFHTICNQCPEVLLGLLEMKGGMR